MTGTGIVQFHNCGNFTHVNYVINSKKGPHLESHLILFNFAEMNLF